MGMTRARVLGLVAAASLMASTGCNDGAPDDPGPTGDSAADTEPDGPQDTGCGDADQDGFACDDCDDDDPTVFPGAEEACDGVDTNCDDVIPPGEALLGDTPACATCAEAGLWPLVRDAPSDAALIDDLAAAIDGNGACDYSDTTTWMYTVLDKRMGEVEGVYTGYSQAVGSEKPDPSVMNTEHTWPRSLGGGVGVRECDLHHLFPTQSDANNARANHRFGIVAPAAEVEWSDGGSLRGLDASGEMVFQPRPIHQGNVARAMLYMWLRYDPAAVDDAHWTLFREWHADDPPTARDVRRSLDILAHQGNVNPFVVCPSLVERVAAGR